MKNERLGGAKRKQELEPEQLTIEDLIAVTRDVRENADRVYRDIYNEFTYVTDVNRSAQDDWVTEARETNDRHQEMVVENLEEKVEQAPETASDEFMYQDKQEAKKELDVARKIFEDLSTPIQKDQLEYRTWNTLPYERYRGSDE